MILTKFVKFIFIPIVWVIAFSQISRADTKVSLYFSNDSVNGIKISDAYETHNMGFLVENTDVFLQLDLGIVSPDMHLYKNEYRVANRSFGEIITLSLGKAVKIDQKFDLTYFVEVKSAGSFGIDEMQDFMHKFLTLQPVNAVNDLVRMPDKQWIGFGVFTEVALDNENLPFDSAGIYSYFGSDRVEISPFAKKSTEYKKINFFGELGLRTVFYDEIVEAPPIYADHRTLLPYFEIGSRFSYFGADWFIKDRFSLPTIKSDSSLFGVLSAGVSFTL